MRKIITDTQAELIKVGCLKIFDSHGQDISKCELAWWQYNKIRNSNRK